MLWGRDAGPDPKFGGGSPGPHSPTYAKGDIPELLQSPGPPPPTNPDASGPFVVTVAVGPGDTLRRDVCWGHRPHAVRKLSVSASGL